MKMKRCSSALTPSLAVQNKKKEFECGLLIAGMFAMIDEWMDVSIRLFLVCKMSMTVSPLLWSITL